METHTDSIQPNEASLRKIKDDLRLLMRDAEGLLKSTAGDLGEKAKEARERLSLAMEDARHTCEKLEVRAKELGIAADRVVRENPYQTMGIAFGGGLLLGVLMARR